MPEYCDCNGEIHYKGKDLVCENCGSVWHYCKGDNCPYETEPQVSEITYKND